jgi:hypothetical protein
MAPMMETVSTTGKSYSLYETKQRNIPEGSLYIRRRENLKSQPTSLMRQHYTKLLTLLPNVFNCASTALVIQRMVEQF